MANFGSLQIPSFKLLSELKDGFDGLGGNCNELNIVVHCKLDLHDQCCKEHRGKVSFILCLLFESPCTYCV